MPPKRRDPPRAEEPQHRGAIERKQRAQRLAVLVEHSPMVSTAASRPAATIRARGSSRSLSATRRSKRLDITEVRLGLDECAVISVAFDSRVPGAQRLAPIGRATSRWSRSGGPRGRRRPVEDAELRRIPNRDAGREQPERMAPDPAPALPGTPSRASDRPARLAPIRSASTRDSRRSRDRRLADTRRQSGIAKLGRDPARHESTRIVRTDVGRSTRAPCPRHA